MVKLIESNEQNKKEKKLIDVVSLFVHASREESVCACTNAKAIREYVDSKQTAFEVSRRAVLTKTKFR